MCTTVAIGKNATIDGSVIIAHSDDDVADERFIFVPSKKDIPAGTMRPVYYDDASLGHDMIEPKTGKTYNASDLYRYIGSSRGPYYEVSAEIMEKEDLYNSIPIGYIPEERETFSYFDCNYGVMNEKRLMIGECTCGAKVHPEPSPTRLFYASELSRVALERCYRAQDAVRLMGKLIMEYGYHGTGETLLVGDDNEAWVMEMCGYDPEGSAGLWVAQRVPDNGLFVAANQFRIRDIDTASKDVMYSANLHQVCLDLGWWNPDKTPLLDWTASVSYGEYSHPYYSLRRVWRVLTKAKPSLTLPAWVENGYTKAYPFSVIPDVKLDVAAVSEIFRDHYEGTEFDMTDGKGAGPWSDPTRYENNPDKGNTWELSVNTPKGAWERPISIYRCGIFWINQSNERLKDAPSNGISWIGLDRPDSNCLMPFYCQITELSDCVQTMNLLDFNFKSAWWAFYFVANYSTIKYSFMIKDIVDKRQELENAAYQFVKDNQEADIPTLTVYCQENAEKVRNEWWSLAKHLIVTYSDGCITTKDCVRKKTDYPTDWLRDAGYYQGPIYYGKSDCRSNQKDK